MTGGLQTTGQRLTDRHAAPTATETDTQDTYSQQEYAMPNPKSMTSVPRPAWATHSHLDTESPATIYHGLGYEVEDLWAERAVDTLSVEVYVADDIEVTDHAVDYRRHEPLVHITSGIVTLAAAAEFADALVTALVKTVGDDEHRAMLDNVLLAAEELKAKVREHQTPVPGRAGRQEPDTFRALTRCEHDNNKHATCPECHQAHAATRKAGA